jgi:hypothetical protein
MTLSTLPRFLIGQRQAIVEIVNCRASLWLGAIFVLSAGFAREYNQEDLLHDAWYLLVPLVASLATSFFLHGIIYLVASASPNTEPKFLESYRRFLSLYWMTAPLAWLYALPVEQYFSAGDSVRANLSLLGLVSLWRLLLMARCVSVLFGSSYISSFLLVIFFADSLALGILYFTPLPIFNIMGGIPLTESEWVIRDTATIVQFFGVVTWPVWFIAALVIFGSNKLWTPLDVSDHQTSKVSEPLWGLAIFSVAAWIVVLPQTQPAQQLRRQAEIDLLNGRVAEGLRLMSAHDRGDFPRHWDPPPWQGYGQDEPPLVGLIQTFEKTTSDWVAEVFFDKLKRRIGTDGGSTSFWDSMDQDEFSAYMSIFENTPQGLEILRNNVGNIRFAVLDHSKTENGRKKQLRAVLDKLAITVEEPEDR